MAHAHGVAAHEREPVARAEANGSDPCRMQRRLGGDKLLAEPSLALSHQRQRDVCQRGQVAGAERAELTSERDEAGIERGHQGVEQLVRDSRATRPELVGARGHRGAHALHPERPARSARVAAEKSQLILRPLVLVQAMGAQRADTRGYPVEIAPSFEHGGGSPGSRPVARSRLLGELHACAIPRNSGDGVGLEGRPVENLRHDGSFRSRASMRGLSTTRPRRRRPVSRASALSSPTTVAKSGRTRTVRTRSSTGVRRPSSS